MKVSYRGVPNPAASFSANRFAIGMFLPLSESSF
jgi:hypothetical protein